MAAADAGPKMVRLGNKVIPADHFTSKRKRSKKARIARALKAQEPKIIEDPKRVLFFRGLRTSEQCAGLMKDLVRALLSRWLLYSPLSRCPQPVHTSPPPPCSPRRMLS